MAKGSNGAITSKGAIVKPGSGQDSISFGSTEVDKAEAVPESKPCGVIVDAINERAYFVEAEDYLVTSDRPGVIRGAAFAADRRSPNSDPTGC